MFRNFNLAYYRKGNWEVICYLYCWIKI